MPKADPSTAKKFSRKRIGTSMVSAADLALAKSESTTPKTDEPIELFPHGISVTTPLGRPVLVLKDKASIEVLPVWMQPLDAGVALAELSHGSGATPHAVTRRLFEALDLKLESCTFVDVVGHHQFVDLVFNKASIEGVQPVVTRLERVRADEAMSFCLQARAHFFSTRAFMARCRDLDVDISKLETNLSNGLLPELKSEMEMSSKKQPYVM